MNDKLFAGFHPDFRIHEFGYNEQKIINIFSKEWFITFACGRIVVGKSSEYSYFLMKPLENYSELFNLDREVIVMFSPYEYFQPRTFDALDYIHSKHRQLRLEKICSVIISKDTDIKAKLKNLLKEDVESQILIPFSYYEFEGHIDPYFLRNRFKTYFYSRDLFAFEAPLRKDLYFFGRTDLVHSIVNRHRSSENNALFGLRRTGKTSIIFAVQRALKKINQHSIFIDCQNPAFHKRTWNKALYYIINEIRIQLELKIRLSLEENYTEENASILFEKDLNHIYQKLNKKSFLLIFDEIENITFNISPTKHWSDGYDFIYFWQTLRSVFHRLERVFTFMLVGTNPMCVETPLIQKKDNPIFNQVPFNYIPGFDVEQTREMVRKLGRLMGLKFDEIIFSKLTEDYGGHPFLIRHVCSVINKISDSQRPVYVNKAIYQQAQLIFNDEYQSYIALLIEVLKEFYADEYDMLEFLAIQDYETFKAFADSDIYYVNHLLGYGIIDKAQNQYSFKIEALKIYLQNKNQFKKLNLSESEKLSEISKRRNSIEPKIRQIVHNQLKAFHGKNAHEIVLNTYGGRRKSQYTDRAFEKLFDPNESIIYFDDLRRLIVQNWDCFKNIFETDKDEFNGYMKVINKYRKDAHSASIDNDEMNHFRYCMNKIEKITENL